MSFAINRPTWSAGYHTSCSQRPSCAHPSAVAPPNGHRRWPKFARPAFPPYPIAARATNSSSRMPSGQRSWCSVAGRAVPHVAWCRAAWRSWLSARLASCCPNCSKPTCSRRSHSSTCWSATTSRKARSCTSSTPSRRAPRWILHVLRHRSVSHCGGHFSADV